MAEPIDNTESTSSAHLILSHQIDQPPTISAESLDISEPSEQPEATTPAPLNMSEAMDIELTSSTSLDIANPIDNPQTCSAPSNVSESVDDSEQVTSALPNISELSDNAEGTSPAPLTLVGSTDDTEASPASLDASEAIENPEATSSAPHNASEQTDNPETTASNAPTIPPTDHIAEPDNTILQETLRVIQSIEVPPVQATNPETEDTSTQTTSPGSLSLNATQSEVLSAIEARSSSTTRLSRRRAYGSAPPVPDPKWHYNVARMVALLSVHDDGWEPFEAIERLLLQLYPHGHQTLDGLADDKERVREFGQDYHDVIECWKYFLQEYETKVVDARHGLIASYILRLATSFCKENGVRGLICDEEMRELQREVRKAFTKLDEECVHQYQKRAFTHMREVIDASPFSVISFTVCELTDTTYSRRITYPNEDAYTRNSLWTPSTRSRRQPPTAQIADREGYSDDDMDDILAGAQTVVEEEENVPVCSDDDDDNDRDFEVGSLQREISAIRATMASLPASTTTDSNETRESESMALGDRTSAEPIIQSIRVGVEERLHRILRDLEELRRSTGLMESRVEELTRRNHGLERRVPELHEWLSSRYPH
ncbi:hypothetical protein GLAREA_00823 [Glarea lozoyensis ATCC 20868]|uniref:Uncharacterized protein n=1 Tax=Glarea lozoyensis (strain ATCC 20868 / MF5171) TaxID=1116229 RepID=S3DTB1_GLAL2|nr:uncharacterized protein GLAREA_00823 [Glarea lozoyensis ATCC 20868]EPE29663.1 hypothetical protein GLAREA_00823 [Glarea lozoyensis ATCC 20868]